MGNLREDSLILSLNTPYVAPEYEGNSILKGMRYQHFPTEHFLVPLHVPPEIDNPADGATVNNVKGFSIIFNEFPCG